MPGKGRAVGYTNFYNGNSDRPANAVTKMGSNTEPEDETEENLKKQALKRRLLKNRAKKDKRVGM